MLDLSPLGANDTRDLDDPDGTRVAFCALIGSHWVDVVVLSVNGVRYRLLGSALPPVADYVETFGLAWRRCLDFIDTNGLKSP